MKKSILLVTLCITTWAWSQVPTSDPLFQTLKKMDSLIFDIGFNECRTEVYNTFVAEDLEFYHDQAGVTNNREGFLASVKNNICGNSEVKNRRELREGSLQVFPLYNNGKLYGAIQTGEHRFFQKRENQPEQAGSTALFTHLWLKQKKTWVLKRVLSYAHHNTP
ncbi:MAG: DUF4440 domain-containing protein [Flavobacteriaceae bacterium]|nr:DUF4440 domain-containing protein [Flavobacteriaceae bacterium]|tara:strand:+ start:4211 stop:4702 length:492 start_codon:yes stop_codon:yes gene_type:complete